MENRKDWLGDALNFQGNFGYDTDDLANTSGLMMHGISTVDWAFDPWKRYSGDHVQLGADAGYGTQIGIWIRDDYLNRTASDRFARW